MLFQDRRDAGRLLAKKLTEYGNRRERAAEQPSEEVPETFPSAL